ncbi:tryptophan--tRNA ligase [bacterium]|nr:tryptophan--tRNA ligase [bacterium]
MSEKKKILFSGIQPSGNLHIGNYIGAISQWLEMQENYNCIFCVVDYHAITVKQDPEILRKKIIEIAKIYLALGIDPKKSIIFQQSDIKEHTELAWILNTITRINDLKKMTQYKDKTKRLIEKTKNKIKNKDKLGNILNLKTKEISRKILSKEDSAGVGLFDYPVLMAADILLYDTEIVPVGDDQAQHVELTRTLARRFNKQFGDTFIIPELKFRKEGARIMGLDNPEKKMSKSALSELNYISLTDNPEKGAKKIMKATTDSGSEIKYNPEKKPGISNLLTIYSLFGGKDIKTLEKEYKNKKYGEFKKDLAEIIKKFLTNFQKKYNKISGKEVEKILENGSKKLKVIADKKIKEVKKKIGVL